jgi:hypothetical protein
LKLFEGDESVEIDSTEERKMPNRDVHGPVGTASGGMYSVYMSYGQQLWHVMAEAAGGAIGG